MNYRNVKAVLALVLAPGEVFRDQLRDALARSGFEIAEATSPAEVHEVIAAKPHIDLFVADFAITEAIRIAEFVVSHKPRAKSIVLSTHPEYVCRNYSQDERISFLEKPFSWREFSERIAGLGFVPEPA